MNAMTRAERAKLTQLLVTTLESMQQMVDILIPEDEGTECPHPPSEIEHEESMDDEPSPYRCRKCGAEQSTPFHTGA